MSYIEEGLKSLYLRIRDSTSVDQQGFSLFRIFFGLFNLFFPLYFGWIGDVPGSFYSPPIWSAANFFTNFPPGWVFITIDVIIITLLFFITVGIKTRISAFMVFFLLIFAQGFHYSLGKIDHGILFTLSFLALAFTNSGTEYALVKDRVIHTKYTGAALALFGIFISFGLFTAGFPKLISWVDFDLNTSGILDWYYKGYYTLERQRFLASYVPYVPMFFMELGDYFAVALELSGFFFLIKSKRYWRYWLLSLSVFHLVNVLILNIAFLGHIVVYGVFLLPPVFARFIKGTVNGNLLSTIFIGAFGLTLFRLFERTLGEVTTGYLVNEDLLAIFFWGFLIIIGIICVFFTESSTVHASPVSNSSMKRK